MAAYTDIISTVGGSTSNSYVSGAQADAFAAFQSWEAAWLAKTESERTIALVNACMWLETIDYGGTRCDPSTDDAALPQALAWPRSGVSCDGVEATCAFIPKEIREAQVMVAYNLLVNPDLITGTPGGDTTPPGVFVSKNQLGELIQEFTEYTNQQENCNDCATPGIVEKLPWLKSLLGCWADIGSTNSRILLRVRS